MRDLMILQHVVALLVGKLCHPKNDFCQKWQGYSMFDKFAYRLYKIVIKVLKNVKLVPITMNDYSVRLTACRYKGVLPRVLSRCAVLYLSCAVPCWDKKNLESISGCLVVEGIFCILSPGRSTC